MGLKSFTYVLSNARITKLKRIESILSMYQQTPAPAPDNISSDSRRRKEGQRAATRRDEPSGQNRIDGESDISFGRMEGWIGQELLRTSMRNGLAQVAKI